MKPFLFSFSRTITNSVNINKDVNWIFDGDSLTEGFYFTGEYQYYPRMVRYRAASQFKSITFNSFGVSGQTTQAMLSDQASQILPLFSNVKENLIVTWEDVNQFLFTTKTPAQNKVFHETYFANCKATDPNVKTILLLSYYPRQLPGGGYSQNGLWNTTRLNKQHDFMQLCVNNGVSNCDLIIDLRNDPLLGGARYQELGVDNPYFHDSIHLEKDGYDVVATNVLNGIKSFYPTMIINYL